MGVGRRAQAKPVTDALTRPLSSHTFSTLTMNENQFKTRYFDSIAEARQWLTEYA
ncbi:MAG: hypothetical protein HC880_11515 [Bacteroidia bacterium]|nr:hypothetical protein [Bacteroidia bacterium]